MSQFFKIVVLLIAFGGVVYVMRMLQSPNTSAQMNSPDNPMSMLLGSDLRPLNWCMTKTEKLEIVASAKTISDAATLSRYCEIMIEPVVQSDMQVDDYQVVAVVSGEGKEKKLEKNSKGVFRVDGFPFHSKQLEKLFY